MQIPQRSVVPCSGLTSWVYGANHAGITAVEPMGGRHPQRAPSSPWLLHTVPLKHSSLRVVTDGKLFCSVLRTEELPAINSVSAIFLIYLGPSLVAENGFPNEMTKYSIASGNLLQISRFVNLEAPFYQADQSKSIFSPGCGWFPSILTVVFVLIGVLFFFLITM